MVLDDKRYKFIAVGAGLFGANVTLNLYEVSRSGKSLLFRAGAYGQEGRVEGDASRIQSIMTSLLQHGSYQQETKEGKIIRISR